VTIGVTQPGGRVLVTIEDDGLGGADPAEGTGLRGLGDRIEALGGRLSVESLPQRGTRLFVEVPV
jgi:signal transduction histidine kinase